MTKKHQTVIKKKGKTKVPRNRFLFIDGCREKKKQFFIFKNWIFDSNLCAKVGKCLFKDNSCFVADLKHFMVVAHILFSWTPPYNYVEFRY